jgi:hypothetical protein
MRRTLGLDVDELPALKLDPANRIGIGERDGSPGRRAWCSARMPALVSSRSEAPLNA